MKLLPIRIEVSEVVDNISEQVLYEYDLKINYNRQGDVLTILDERIKDAIDGFDLSHLENWSPSPSINNQEKR